jgi:hypothetical protein
VCFTHAPDAGGVADDGVVAAAITATTPATVSRIAHRRGGVRTAAGLIRIDSPRRRLVTTLGMRST